MHWQWKGIDAIHSYAFPLCECMCESDLAVQCTLQSESSSEIGFNIDFCVYKLKIN